MHSHKSARSDFFKKYVAVPHFLEIGPILTLTIQQVAAGKFHWNKLSQEIIDTVVTDISFQSFDFSLTKKQNFSDQINTKSQI